MQAYLGLTTWSEVPFALRSLQEAGIRLAFVSNMTAQMLEAGITHAGLDGVFAHVLSTDQIRAYKPEPRAYQMAIDALQLQRDAWLHQGDLRPATWEAQCPLHQGRFDLRTGHPTVWPSSEPVQVYAVRVEGEDILVGLPA
jgi:nitrite reductase/ring-hydroxylating ferredoxin subunit